MESYTSTRNALRHSVVCAVRPSQPASMDMMCFVVFVGSGIEDADISYPPPPFNFLFDTSNTLSLDSGWMYRIIISRRRQLHQCYRWGGWRYETFTEKIIQFMC
jgi:hypothetical protein